MIGDESGGDVTVPSGDEDEQRLLALLRALGATEDEIASTPMWQRSALALEVSLRGPRPSATLAEAAESAGTTTAAVEAFWHALGFAEDAAAARLPAELADAQQVLADVRAFVGDEAVLGLARVVGNATARLAEAVVDAFRVGFEQPELERGARYSDVVASYVTIAREALPAFESLVSATLRAHIVRVAAGAWAPDVSGASRRHLAIGFADLVGYTALARTLEPARLASLLRSFEDCVADVLSTHGGRLVKQIGDGVMFTAETADAAAETGLALTAACAASDVLPPVRVGIAVGDVLTQYGDYYGDVVNLAARLVALAAPGTVVASEAAARDVTGSDRERLPDQALKGFGAPAAVYRLVARPQSAER